MARLGAAFDGGKWLCHPVYLADGPMRRLLRRNAQRDKRRGGFPEQVLAARWHGTENGTERRDVSNVVVEKMHIDCITCMRNDHALSFVPLHHCESGDFRKHSG